MAGILDFLSLQGGEGGPGLLGNIGQYMGDNRNALMMAGLGLASGNGWGEGAGNALRGFSQGQTQDQTQAGLRAAIPHIMARQDIDPAVKAAIMRNPAMATQYLTAMAKPPEYGFRDVNGVVMNTNPQTGQANQLGSIPQIRDRNPEHITEANTLSMVRPGMASPPMQGQPSPQPSPMAPAPMGPMANPNDRNDPTMGIPQSQIDRANAPQGVPNAVPPLQTPGVQTSIISQPGPRKAPDGFRWLDPRNPELGMSPIPGSAATHVPAEISARLAMMSTSERGWDSAVRTLTAGRGAAGMETSVAGLGRRIQSAADVGEYGDAYRTVNMGAESALRLMTGANAPDKEYARNVAAFVPTQFDNEATVRSKLNNLKTFMTAAREHAMQGRQPITMAQAMAIARGEGPTSQPKSQAQVPSNLDPADPLGLRRR